MTETVTQPGAHSSRPPEPRTLRRRRSLPGSRAVVGGFLVAAAAMGTFGAYTAANAAPEQRFVVVTRDVHAGERLGSRDLALVAAGLPDEQQGTVLSDVAVADGAVAVGPLAAGQLLSGSDVVKLDGVVGRAQLSIPVEPARANNGELRRGELVDVIATTTTAGATGTETVAGDAVVVRVFAGDQALGSSAGVVVTLSLAEAELEAVAEAAATATITLARVSGLEREQSERMVLDGVVRDGALPSGEGPTTESGDPATPSVTSPLPEGPPEAAADEAAFG